MLFPARMKMAALGATLAVGICATHVSAGLVDPGLSIQWWINGTPSGTINPVGVYNEGAQLWQYNGGVVDEATGVSLNFSLNGDPDPLLSGNLAVENPNLAFVDIVLQVILPIAPALTSGSSLQGSVAVGLTADAGGGSISSLAGTPLWQGLIDGVSAGAGASMLQDPFSLSLPGFGSTGTSSNFGIPVGIPGPDVLNSIGIKISFRLTQFDQASITSVFHVTPAPGALALLGLAGLVGGRRRRRA